MNLERIRALEANSAWRGVSRKTLMENAGAGVAEEIWRKNPPEEGVLIFAGTGNNGGDGLVAARHLADRGAEVELILLGRPRNITSSQAEANWQILSQMEDDIDFHIVRDSTELDGLDLEGADVAVDAILGTGIGGDLREPAGTAVGEINGLDAYKVAVDVPTGLDPETGEVHGDSTECDLTVTFHDAKPGLREENRRYTGEVVVRSIGIPKVAGNRTGPGDVRMAISPRRINSHKGENGRVLVIGGSSRYVGAPALTGLAALRTGCDLSTVAAPSETASILNSFSPDLITLGLPGEDFGPDTLPEVLEEVEKSSAVLIGPGLGTSDGTEEALVDLMEEIVDEHADLPVLLDADGLKIVSGEPDLLGESNSLVTPHSGEFEILTGSELPEETDERAELVSKTARELNTSILLKSHLDICAGPGGERLLNDTGNPGMTVGGTGDALSGIAGSFLSRGADPFRAGVAGAFICGTAGDLCREEIGQEFTASDLIEMIPAAISEARKYW